MVSLKVLFILAVSLALVNCSVITKSRNKTETGSSKANNVASKGKIDTKTGNKTEYTTSIKTESKSGIKTEGGIKSETKSGTKTDAKANVTIPCTCGVFLTGQFVRGSSEQPKGDAVFIHEVNKTFSCNAIGQKQCQTKCLEAIVGHLPNSANLLCATLNRDCRKERAYLFIKNCKDVWINTNLAAGKEYCCKNGQSYPCPLV